MLILFEQAHDNDHICTTVPFESPKGGRCTYVWVYFYLFKFKIMERKINFQIELQGIVHLLTSRLGDGDRSYRHIYAMRLINATSEEVVWLHQDTTMFQVRNHF